jgi:hypothetical protein
VSTQAENAAFLQRLWRGARYGYYWRPTPDDTKRRGESFWVYAASPPPPPAGWHDVYFAVHPLRSAGTASERSGQNAERVGAVGCLYADFDAKHQAGGMDGVMAHIATLPLRPSILVATGGGVHAYWLFDKPVAITTPERRTKMERAQRLWVDAIVHADPAAKDLGRVLRLPGTRNYKYDPPRTVSIIEFSDRQYSLEAIAEVLRPAIAQEEERRAVAAQCVSAENGGGRVWGWHLERALREAQKGHRHNAALKLAFRLKEAGASQLVAEELVGQVIGLVTDRPTRGEVEGIVRYVYR